MWPLPAEKQTEIPRSRTASITAASNGMRKFGNVFTPGGLGSAQSFEGVNFTHAVIAALERKVQYMGYYQRDFNNIDMATL